MVTVNGEQKNAAGKTMLEFLKEEGFCIDKVVVERNLVILSKDNLDKIIIQENDSIEVLSFVGGG